MSLFKSSRDKNGPLPNPSPGSLPPSPLPQPGVPVTVFDLTARYDFYVNLVGEERLYENVKVIGIRTFDRIDQFHSGTIGGLLEIEAVDGARMMIPQYGIQLICQHGAQPNFRVLRRADGKTGSEDAW